MLKAFYTEAQKKIFYEKLHRISISCFWLSYFKVHKHQKNSTSIIKAGADQIFSLFSGSFVVVSNQVSSIVCIVRVSSAVLFDLG